MMNLRRFHVRPYLPAQLEPLVGLARNLWWTWNREAREVFMQIDRALFEQVSENPLALLARTPQARLDELARDDAFLASIDRVGRALADYLGRETWFQRTFAADEAIATSRIAYFSMEFGIHECLPVYSGGLGVLAGDHLKSASDLGLPLIGVGIAFSQGYFRQSLDDEGWQNERYPPNDWHDLTVSPVVDGAGDRVVVSVPIAQPEGGDRASRDVHLEAWRVEVGRVPLLLLDANLTRNAPEDRLLTNTLYGGDRVHRIRQEILLGVGGVRMLAAIGVHPAVCHMNEGHSAFLSIDRVRQLMVEHGASFDVARSAAAAGNVFTTHTPVPAGNDVFPHAMIAPYLQVLGAGLGKTGDEVMRLGSADPDGKDGHFSMPVLAIRMADRYNGVSVLHGREARVMWSRLWPTLASHEVPIDAITNGVHVGTWVTDEMAELYDRALPGWRGDAPDAATWARIHDVHDEDLWRVHEQRRARLVHEIRERMSAFAERRSLPKLLDPRALTIGFARRFATYKRATLLLRDPARLERILTGAGRPVQLVFSGKAHPQDLGGKELIRDIVRASMHDAFKGRILFIEDYDMGVARSLVAGVDVWLNTPRRPLEASGTSGMKACLNGVLHASVLDGWWPEAYAGDNGYAVGRGEEYADTERGDRIEAEALYELLEQKIVPLFYERDTTDLPRGWIARMKRSIATIGPVFSSTRMVREYAEKLYAPAARRFRQLTREGIAGARAFEEWQSRVAVAWPRVRVEAVEERSSSVAVGDTVEITADVSLGGLHPADVAVELYHGRLQGGHTLGEGESTPMTLEADLGAHRYRFRGKIAAVESGEHAFAVRVLPSHDELPNRFATRLVAWS